MATCLRDTEASQAIAGRQALGACQEVSGLTWGTSCDRSPDPTAVFMLLSIAPCSQVQDIRFCPFPKNRHPQGTSKPHCRESCLQSMPLTVQSASSTSAWLPRGHTSGVDADALRWGADPELGSDHSCHCLVWGLSAEGEVHSDVAHNRCAHVLVTQASVLLRAQT
jgi:hypothetical protein